MPELCADQQIAPAAVRRRSASEAERFSEFAQALVAAAFAIPLDELRAHTRRRAPVAFARQSAMYLVHVGLGLSATQVADLFARDRTTVAHACRLIEERRDDPAIDGVLSKLESACADYLGRGAAR